MNPILSICIPTYNRAKYLDEAIKSIASQITSDIRDRIEICISDNASSDNTDKIIEKWHKQLSIPIIYNKNNQNLGADRNFLKVIEIANGSFCWYIGSDDALKNGAIRRIINEIENNPNTDIFLCNRTVCDLYMKPLREGYWLRKKNADTIFNFSNKHELIEYFNEAQSIGAVFSYLSSLVFRREQWNKVVFNEKFIGTAYSYVPILLSFIARGCQLKYIKDSLVLCRLGNKSFSSFSGEGDVERFMLDINGYLLFADTIFNDDLYIKKTFLSILRRSWENKWFWLPKIRSLSTKSEWLYIKKKLILVGYGNFVLVLAESLGSFKYPIYLAMGLKRRLWR